MFARVLESYHAPPVSHSRANPAKSEDLAADSPLNAGPE
jgi:hypothetical protein